MSPDRQAGVERIMDRLVRCLVWALGIYWLAHALVSPVTTWDSQTYNLARLELFERGGFFGNELWNTSRQIMFPWAFDAVHYALLPFNWTMGLPSFACFVGTLLCVGQLAGARAGWWCALAFLALPVVVMQSVATKNDMAVVFAVAAWALARRRWQEEGEPGYLTWMAIAIGFGAGAKTTGVMIMAALAAFTFWEARGRSVDGRRFALALAVSALLLGSAETYLQNYALWGNPLGDTAVLDYNRNRDGLAGGFANVIRFGYGTIDPGWVLTDPRSFAAWLERSCVQTLHFLGLENVGYCPRFDDQSIVLLRSNREDTAGFGPLGAVVLLAAILALFRPRLRQVTWVIGTLGLAVFVFLCLTLAWASANWRFFMLAFGLMTVALTLRIVTTSGSWSWLLRAIWLAFLGYTAIGFPFHAFNRQPADLREALVAREFFSFRERPLSYDALTRFRAAVAAAPVPPVVVFSATDDSWVLPFLRLPGVDLRPVQKLNPAALAQLSADAAPRPIWLLLLNRTMAVPADGSVQRLDEYADESTLWLWAGSPR